VESSCERGNEPSGSIKCWETTEWLHNLWPLEWYSAIDYRLCVTSIIHQHASVDNAEEELRLGKSERGWVEYRWRSAY
jgi:hypothetical protein